MQIINASPLLTPNNNQFLNAIRHTLWLALFFDVIAYIFLIVTTPKSLVVFIILSAVSLIELWLLFIISKHPSIAAFVYLGLFWLAVTSATFTYGLITNFVYLSIYLLIIIASLMLFGGRITIVIFVVTILITVTHVVADFLTIDLLFLKGNGRFISQQHSDFLFFLLFILLLYLTLRILFLIIQQTTQYATEVARNNQELEAIRASLAQEVSETTSELRQNESQYKTLLEAIPDIIFRIDKKGVYQDFYLPPTFPHTGKETALDRIDISIYKIFPPVEADRFLQDIISVLESGKSSLHEYTHSLFGNYLEMRLVKANADEVVGLVRDISERKRAEMELHESEGRNRALLEALPDVMIRFDKEGCCLDFHTPKHSSFAHNLPSGQIGQSIHEIFSQETAVLIQHHLTVALKTNKLQTFEFNHLDLARCFEIRMVASGKDEVTAVIRDITHNKTAAKQKQEEVKRLQQIISAIQGSVLILSQNPSHYVLWFNEEASQNFGMQSNQISGAHFSLINYLQNPVDFDQITHQYESKGELKAFVTRFKQKEGSYFWGRLSITDMMYDQQKANLIIIENIDELKIAEESFQQAQKMQSLGLLAGGIAHDFNNLLSGILAQSSLALAKLPSDHPIRPHIEKSVKSAEWAANLTYQMLAYSGRGRFDIRNININQLLQENIELLIASLPKSIHLSTKFDPSLPLIEVDTNQLQQVIMNLLINATQAMDKQNQDTISIATGREFLLEEDKRYAKYTGGILPSGEYVTLAVSDNGSGMNEETVMQIFDPFFTTKESGRGLGLSAVLGIMQGHKGGVAVESHLGNGTTIKLLFPASTHLQMPFADADTVVQSEEQESLPSLVLMIDDEEVLRDAVVDILEWEGIDIITAVNGKEGIELYQKHMDKISLVLLDLSMPGMSGEETLHALRQINEQVKIIICSGYSKQEVSHLFKDKDVTGFLAKPFKVTKLVEILHQYM